MPRYDGKGPMGQGPLTGRGLGRCAPRGQTYPARDYGRRMGCGMGRGMARGAGRALGYTPNLSEKEMLEEDMRYLEAELKAVKDALNNTKED